MMISCREASRLASHALETPLSWWQWLKLKAHARMCAWCCGHHRDLDSLRQAVQTHPDDQIPTEILSPEARERIMAIVRKQLEADGSDEAAL